VGGSQGFGIQFVANRCDIAVARAGEGQAPGFRDDVLRAVDKNFGQFGCRDGRGFDRREQEGAVLAVVRAGAGIWPLELIP
jgi:hypothetical protein